VVGRERGREGGREGGGTEGKKGGGREMEVGGGERRKFSIAPLPHARNINTGSPPLIPSLHTVPTPSPPTRSLPPAPWRRFWNSC